MKACLFLFVFALLCGCADFEGHVANTTSKLDGERQVSVNPAWLHGGGFRTPAKIGGFWTDKAPDTFFLEVVTLDDHEITGLRIGTDGKIQNFSPDKAERHLFRESNARRFVVPITLVDELVNAKTAILQIQHPQSVVEVNFSFEQQTFARPKFRKALEEIRAIKKGP